MRITLSAVLLAATLSAFAAPFQLLKNPTLLDTTGNGLPDSWWKLTQREGTLEKHNGEPRFLRLGIKHSGQSSIEQQFCDLPADATQIAVAAKIRWADIKRGKKGYMTGAIQVMFADKKNKKVGDYQVLHSFTGSSEDWQTIDKTFDRPEGATKVRIQLALYSVMSGTLDVAWVTVSPGMIYVTPSAEELAEAHAPTTKPDRTLLDRFPLPPGDGPEFGGVRGVSLLGNDALTFLKPYRNLDKWTVKRVPVQDQPFAEALEVTILQQPAAVWDMQLRAKTPIPINKGDILHLTYYARGIEIDAEFAETSFLIALQLDRTPWTSVISTRSRNLVTDGWRKVQKVVVATETFDANETAFNLQFGLEPQTFQIGGLTCYNYGHTIDPAILPVTKRKLYDGHQPDAPWRAEAAKRIEQIRKGDLAISVLDADGKPVPDAQVKVEMTRHAFGWGSAMYIWSYAGDSENAQTYRKNFLELFNLMVPENGLKWSTWEQDKARQYTKSMLKWAKENNIDVRGHTLIWPSWRRSPKRLQAYKSNPEALRTAIRKHFEDIMGATRGQITEWDVMNEPTTNYDLIQFLGKDAPAEWFKLAKELDPNARVVLNENQILAGTKLKSLEIYLDRIIAGGAPLEGIGIQGHLGLGTAAPPKMLSILDRLAKYNVPISITELDILVDDEQLQAMYLRDVLTCAFSHPSMSSVTFWGFWDGRHWKNNNPLYRKDWTAKPGLDTYRQLVLNDWWTRETVTTDANGKASLRGFHGNYQISTTIDGQPVQTTTQLAADGTSVTLQLKAVQ